MKSMFENMIDMVVHSLSGEAKAFYEREFAFFNEVTGISRKLRPFVKKTKAEKKVTGRSTILPTMLTDRTGQN